ncbi:MAG: phenylacetate--CoA ligase [Alphaproteobacteria bacterium]|jgi:phenylacetate-CoA ligase|nr:phenylacetate--CoA ligase [Alphaproteobacteria bacterium]
MKSEIDLHGIWPAHPPQAGEALESLRLSRLQAQVRYCYDASPFYRSKMDACGAAPGDIKSLADFGRLRFTFNKQDERESEEQSFRERGDYLGMHLCADPADVVGISATSGTTGRPTFTYLFTDADMRVNSLGWARALTWMGVGRGDMVMNALGLSMWVVGAIAVSSLIQLGIRAIPVGAEAGVPRILQLAALLRPKALLATPSMAQRLVEQAPQVLGADVSSLGIKAILCCGEPGAGLPEVRRHLERSFNATVHDAMLGAYGVAQLSCVSDDYHGLHTLTPDLVLHELIDPDTLKPIAINGPTVGRLLMTSLQHQARPAFKLDAGDIFQVDNTSCPSCGHAHLRIKVLGRADDMLIVRGVNVYPSSIKDVVAGFMPQVTGEIRIVLKEKPPRITPPLVVRVEQAGELGEEAATRLRGAIEHRIFEILRVRATISLVPPMSLPRSTGKTKLIDMEI